MIVAFVHTERYYVSTKATEVGYYGLCKTDKGKNGKNGWNHYK